MESLYPYIFIIVADVLSSLLKKVIGDGSVRRIKLNRCCPTFLHMLFADNAILFINGTIKEYQNLANLLNQCCFTSSQAINLTKFGIFFNRDCPQQLRRNMIAKLKVPIIEKTKSTSVSCRIGDKLKEKCLLEF